MLCDVLSEGLINKLHEEILPGYSVCSSDLMPMTSFWGGNLSQKTDDIGIYQNELFCWNMSVHNLSLSAVC